MSFKSTTTLSTKMIRRRRIHLPAFPSQQRFLRCAARKKGFSGPVGTGKTVALCYQALLSAARNPHCVGLIGGPTYTMIRDVTLTTMLQILDEKRIRYEYRKSEYVIMLPKARILFRSLENYERLRGPNLAWVGIDELTYCQEEAWHRLEARVRDPHAREPQLFAVWTPKGYDWVYRRFISEEKLNGHEAILARPFENVAVLKRQPDYYEQLKASYDERFYQQEALGEYLNVTSGRVYHAYSEANKASDLRFAPEAGLCWSFDFNVNPMSAIIAQYINGKIFVLDEIVLPNSNTQEMCERLEERTMAYLAQYQAAKGRQPLAITVYGDATGQARSTASKTDYDLIREYFRSRGQQFSLKFDYPKANPPVKDRVNSVNAMLKTASNQIRISVHARCKELITDFREVSWKQTSLNAELDKTSDKKRTHLSDALGYLVWQVAPIDPFIRQNIYN